MSLCAEAAACAAAQQQQLCLRWALTDWLTWMRSPYSPSTQSQAARAAGSVIICRRAGRQGRQQEGAQVGELARAQPGGSRRSPAGRQGRQASSASSQQHARPAGWPRCSPRTPRPRRGSAAARLASVGVGRGGGAGGEGWSGSAVSGARTEHGARTGGKVSSCGRAHLHQRLGGRILLSVPQEEQQAVQNAVDVGHLMGGGDGGRELWSRGGRGHVLVQLDNRSSLPGPAAAAAGSLIASSPAP